MAQVVHDHLNDEASLAVPVSAAVRPGWVASTFESLGIRAYRILWIGTVLSFIGFMMTMTAQNVVAYDLTGSNRSVGWVMFGQGLAMLGLTPFGGAVADRVSKRLLLLVCQATIGVSVLVIGLLILTDAITVFFLAGALLAWKAMGAAGTYFVVAAIFVLVVATLVQLPPSRTRDASGTSVLGDIRLGMNHVAENASLRQIVVGF